MKDSNPLRLMDQIIPVAKETLAGLYNRSRLARCAMIGVALISQIFGLLLAGFLGLLIGVALRFFIS